MGRSLWIIAPNNETECGCSSTATEHPRASVGDAGSRPAFRFLTTASFVHRSFRRADESGLSGKPFSGRAGSSPAAACKRRLPGRLLSVSIFDGSMKLGYRS